MKSHNVVNPELINLFNQPGRLSYSQKRLNLLKYFGELAHPNR